MFDLPPLRSAIRYLDDLEGPACGVRGTVQPFDHGQHPAVLAWLTNDEGQSQVCEFCLCVCVFVCLYWFVCVCGGGGGHMLIMVH